MSHTVLDLDRDLPLSRDDRQALGAARQARVDPTTLEWQWISLAQQFPNLRQSRETAEGRKEFVLPQPW